MFKKKEDKWGEAKSRRESFKNCAKKQKQTQRFIGQCHLGTGRVCQGQEPPCFISKHPCGLRVAEKPTVP